MEQVTYSASVMCANLMRLGDDLASLHAAGCDELHFDIMDGLFVPNITLGADFVKAAKQVSSLPCSAHLMLANPDRYLARFVEAGCDAITVHVETPNHIHRTLAEIRKTGVSPGIAINPATPLTTLDYLLDSVDRVLVMTVEPGFAGRHLIPTAFERVRVLKENIDYRKHNVRIAVDGNIDVGNAALLADAGAGILVLGSSSIFKGGDPGAALREFKKALELKRLALQSPP